MMAYGIFPDDPADFPDVPSFEFVASMAPAIQVIFNPQLREFAAELFPGIGVDAGGGLVMYEVVDVAAILAGCTICESAADLNPFLVCRKADKLGRILHVYDSLKVEPPDGVTSLSLVQAFAAAASALDSSDPLQEDLPGPSRVPTSCSSSPSLRPPLQMGTSCRSAQWAAWDSSQVWIWTC